MNHAAAAPWGRQEYGGVSPRAVADWIAKMTGGAPGAPGPGPDRGPEHEHEHQHEDERGGEHDHGHGHGSRRRHGGRGRGGPSWGGPPWGGPGWGGPPWGPPPWAGRGGRGPWGGPKARRGDVRAAILAVLADADRNGYQIIQEIAARSDGSWRPSPGSVYPTLSQLEDEGLVEADRPEGRRTFRLTEQGVTYVRSHAEEVAAPFASMGDDDPHDLRSSVGPMLGALWQIGTQGSPDQQARARDVLADTRRRLFGILADGDDAEGADKDAT